jgi:large subunit ribosomal protein L10
MATKAKKNEIVAELEKLFEKSQVAIVADLSGFTVAEITQFRRKLDKDKAQCRVAKNTLIELASSKGQFAAIKDLAKGPSALILGYDDAAAPAKTTVQFIKALKKGEIRGGVFENKVLSPQQIGELAELPSKDVLLSGIAGGLDSGARNIVTIFNNIICDIALLAEEVAKKNEGAA